MPVARSLGLRERARLRLHRELCGRLHRRPMPTALERGVISFSFDDFPRTALTEGGTVLQTFGIAATYYVASGLAGGENHMGTQFDAGDLARATGKGHELACHTSSHADLLETSNPTAIAAELGANAVALAPYRHGHAPAHFAYPYGNANLRSKDAVADRFLTCRGIVRGINTSPVDRAYLKANELTGDVADVAWGEALIRRAEVARGWLIFFTHDVREQPSANGCTPAALAWVAALARRSNCQILSVGEAFEALRAASPAPDGVRIAGNA